MFVSLPVIYSPPHKSPFLPAISSSLSSFSCGSPPCPTRDANPRVVFVTPTDTTNGKTSDTHRLSVVCPSVSRLTGCWRAGMPAGIWRHCRCERGVSLIAIHVGMSLDCNCVFCTSGMTPYRPTWRFALTSVKLLDEKEDQSIPHRNPFQIVTR